MRRGSSTREIDLNKTVYELTEYAELSALLKYLGFLEVGSPIVRRTLGRATSIPQGRRKQRKDLKEVVGRLTEERFIVSVL
ncbi:MAG: hypothetical protein QW390_05075 [Candidatus Bathyarchaeia archaeon]